MSAGPEPTSKPMWFKSSYSGGNTTECVECAYAPHGTLVRDSKRAGGPVIAVPAQAWHSFVCALSRGEVGACR
ncbi:DUF397 domain-containing protein [Streptomyces sp. RY43-2]|uniref:DUF397 domain-containing protein n=1 Tax=Streptomyces macrolidinus TaxID=2952607 RepID=A0ABT0Z698_9ACTN|nr:DUF397 domain-containing protein [Streptomyces macrolidinus]MCN9239278.1 DUF397 domain-containing protein [Streptomyces macrolidinus]